MMAERDHSKKPRLMANLTGQVFSAPVSSKVTKETIREVIRLIKHFSEDMTRKDSEVEPPQSWLLKALIEQSGVSHYDSRDWLHSTYFLIGLIEDKLVEEKRGKTQFTYDDKSPMLPSEQGYTACDALTFIRKLRKHISEIEKELHGGNHF